MDGASGTCNSYWKWTSGGGEIIDSGWINRTYNCTEYVAKSTTSYSRGSSLNKTVSSNDRNAYPNNNYSGSIWYVYKGIY